MISAIGLVFDARNPSQIIPASFVGADESRTRIVSADLSASHPLITIPARGSGASTSSATVVTNTIN
jgi:hypothetical protein